MIALASLLAGLVSGLGLIVSGIASPAKLLGFQDLPSRWAPSLAFVMAGAIAVGAVAFAVANRRARSFLGAEMRLPSTRHIDRRLVLGSSLFGIGWGIAGLSPDPALGSLGIGEIKALVCVAAMLVGMGAFEIFECRKRVPMPRAA